MGILAGGIQGARWAWNQGDDNIADRMLGLQNQLGRVDTWTSDKGIVLGVKENPEVSELGVGISVVDDGITNGTNTLTSALAPFESSMVGLVISIIGFGKRFVTSFTNASEIEFSGSPIIAGVARIFTTPIGTSQFTDGVSFGDQRLTSSSAPFNPSHIGTRVTLIGIGSREITTFTSTVEVEVDGPAIPAQQGLYFTVFTDFESNEYQILSGVLIVDSHRVPTMNTAVRMSWRIGERRPDGNPRPVFATAVFIGNYPTQNLEIGQTSTPFTPITNGTGFSVVAGALPDGMVLNAGTGELTGTPTPAGLLGGSPVGEYIGIVIEATGPGGSDQSPPFSITVVGIALPVPELYLPLDINGFDGGGLFGFPVNTNVTFPGDVADYSAGDSALDYGDSPTFRVNGNTALTVSAIVNPNTHPGASARIIEHYDGTPNGLGWFFRIGAGDVKVGVSYGTTDAEQATTALIPTSQFSQTAFTWTAAGSRSDVFIDGVLEALSQDVIGVGALGNDTGRDLIIGNEFGGTRPLDGQMDEVAIWTLALTVNQHATLGWLKERQQALSNWIRGAAPNDPVYDNQSFNEGSPITPFTPSTPSIDPEALPVTYIVYDTLPAGLTLNPADGEVSGTPTVVGVSAIRIASTDGMNLAVSAPFNITVISVGVDVDEELDMVSGASNPQSENLEIINP